MPQSTQSETPKYKLVQLPNKNLSIAELAVALNVLAKLYNKPLVQVIRKLDRVSGNIKALQRVLNGDYKCQWTAQEDELLQSNEGLLIRWKGREDVQTRKEYIQYSKKKKL